MPCYSQSLFDPIPEETVIPRSMVWVSIGIFFILALLFAQRRAPWNDEGWFADASQNLAYKGYMGTSVMEPTGTHLPSPPLGIDRYTYWVLPLYLLVQAGWYKVIGFSPFLMRLPGVFWALGLLWAMYQVADILTGRRDIARLAVCLLAVETLFVNVATLARMDIMAAALSWLALAVYLQWRERNLPVAVLMAYGLAGAACMTHHQAILGVFALIGTTLYLDRSRVTVGLVVLAVLPVSLMAAGWAGYAMQRPDYFRAQIGSNGAGRLSFFSNPLLTLEWEFTRRYFFYGFTAGGNPIRKVLVLVPLALAGAIFTAVFVPRIRRMRGVGLVLGICIVQWLYQATLDGNKLHLYLIHILPSLAILLAAVLYGLWQSRMVAKPLLLAFVMAWAAVGVGSSAMLVKQNHFEQTIDPLRQALGRRTPPGSSIYGSPELGIYIGFDHLVDDLRLGFYSGKIPDYIVMDVRCSQWLENSKTAEPEVFRRARTLLDNAEVVYSGPDYQLYRVTRTRM